MATRTRGIPRHAPLVFANIGVIESEGLVERASHIGTKMEEGFQALQGDGMLAGYRGLGAIWAADLGYDATETREAFLKRGVISRPVANALMFCPPLVISDAEIGQIFDRLEDAIRATSPIAA